MFVGTYYNSIDAKNRMIVPSKHRDKLGGRCVITKGLDKCLYIYSLEDWEKQLDKLSELPESDPGVRAYIRHVCANAMECEFDKQGRILIPQDLTDYAGIVKDLVTMGAMKKIEIWSREVWDQVNSENSESAADFTDVLSQYKF